MEGEMIFKRRAGLLLSGTILASIFVAAPALAQDAQTDQLQRQINALQKQLQTLQSQVTETKQQAKAAQESAQTAQQSVQNIPPGLYNADQAVAPARSSGRRTIRSRSCLPRPASCETSRRPVWCPKPTARQQISKYSSQSPVGLRDS